MGHKLRVLPEPSGPAALGYVPCLFLPLKLSPPRPSPASMCREHLVLQVLLTHLRIETYPSESSISQRPPAFQVDPHTRHSRLRPTLSEDTSSSQGLSGGKEYGGMNFIPGSRGRWREALVQVNCLLCQPGGVLALLESGTDPRIEHCN